MHLTFPKRKGYYTWEELRCLARALGYQIDVFERVIPDFAEGEPGVSFRQVCRLMELNFFNEAFHLTYNLHTAHYNCQLIKKCLVLLDHRFLNFQEIQEIRVAYVAYEHHDMHGMIINEKALLRTLKMCDRTVAPLKLMHRVKHLKENYEAKGRIQIYEFMDLLILCKMWDDVNIRDNRVKGPDKNWRRLYQMDKVKEVFHTYDEKVFELLNKEFEETELNYGDVSFGDRRQFRENPVDKDKNTEQFKTHSTTYKRLQKIIDSTTQQVIEARANGVANKNRPISASLLEEQFIESSPERSKSPPGLGRRVSDKSVERGNKNNQLFDRSKRMSVISARSSVSYASGSRGHLARSLGRKSRATTATSRRQSSVGKITESDWTLVVPVPKLKTPDYKRPKTARLVTADDLERQNDELKKLQYNLETLEVKSKVHLDEDIDIALGKGFRIRSAKRKAEAERNRPPEPKPPPPPRSPVPSPESLRRLSSPRPRTPKGHSDQCDAVMLGIAPTDDSRSEKSGKKGRKKKKKKSGKKKTKGHQFSFSMGRSRMMSAWDDDDTSTDTEGGSTFSSKTDDRSPVQADKPSILKDILYGVDDEEIDDDDIPESYLNVSVPSTPVTPSDSTEHDRIASTPPAFSPKPPPPPPPQPTTSASSGVRNKPREKKVHEPKRKVEPHGKSVGQRQLSTILESELQREEEVGSEDEDTDQKMWREWIKYEQGEDYMEEEEEEEEERPEMKKGTTSRRSSRVRSVSIATEEQEEDDDFWRDITSETVAQAVVKNIRMEEEAVQQKFSPSLTRLEKLQMEYHARTRPAKPTIVQARRLVGRVREEASKGLKKALLRPLS
ncbi:uncharacterized protein DDB_G0284459-like [Branchiostoma lanceolatum]|uniref:uncharacterized protein DDB_G0284459-like n=1 Tax=Branchiostoma lanceolatum TaxID=7740 RepID=UPI003456BDF4